MKAKQIQKQQQEIRAKCKNPNDAKYLPEYQKLGADKLIIDPNLILTICDEISYTHLYDNSVKLTTFFTCCTSYLKPNDLRKSQALKGAKSVGKDNLIKGVLNCFPEKDYVFLTNATQAVMEDEINNYRMIIYSEVNLQRDDKGANAHLVEVLKQLTEGGTSSLKKDIRTGFQSAVHNKQEQKTVIYGTTDTGTDDELSSRFMVGSVEANEYKIKNVNKNTYNWFAGDRDKEGINKIQSLILYLSKKSNSVVLPYCKYLPEDFVDNKDSRSMRDLKRLLSIASSIAWIHQEQRKKDIKKRIISEPVDLLMALIISKDFFNLTYSGLEDARLQKCVDAINELCDGDGTIGNNLFRRMDLQQKLGVSTNTIVSYLKAMKNLSIAIWDHNEGNVQYYKRCQKGVKKVLIGINWRELLKHFEGIKGINFSKSTVLLLEKLEKLCKTTHSGRKDSVSEKIDTLKLTPCKKCGGKLPLDSNNLCELCKNPIEEVVK